MQTDLQERNELEADVQRIYDQASSFGKIGIGLGAALIAGGRNNLAKQVMRVTIGEFLPSPEVPSLPSISLFARLAQICERDELIWWGQLAVAAEQTESAELIERITELMECRTAS